LIQDDPSKSTTVDLAMMDVGHFWREWEVKDIEISLFLPLSVLQHNNYIILETSMLIIRNVAT